MGAPSLARWISPDAGSESPDSRPALVANWETLQRIFIRPEDEASRTALIKYMEQILFGLHDFLRRHVGITRAATLKDLSDRFTESRIDWNPRRKLADVIAALIDEIAPHAVNVASPYFVGHMTSAIPFFMVHLHTIMAALNQNSVKLETSKVVSILERQVLAKLHRMVYDREDGFYDRHVQAPGSTLGGFVSGGTVANLTALWVARNEALGPIDGFSGVEAEGVAPALAARGLDRCVVLVSRLGHYSLRKSGGLLGIGNANVRAVAVDGEGRMDLDDLKRTVDSLSPRTRVMAVVGIAGATETGTVDPLPELADFCEKIGAHFHVDAAWGGPTLLSPKYRGLLDGIQRADSVTVDGHKQFYMPMGCGIVLFRAPTAMDRIAYHAAYVNRPTSVDLGIRSLEGSRAANSLVLGNALEIMGAGGYALLIEHGIETARAFAEAIRRRPLFELVTAPRLNILTYRVFPPETRKEWEAADEAERGRMTERLNEITTTVQRNQREAGRSFVSRTTIRREGKNDVTVFRAVIMNPLTTPAILEEILDEQEGIYWEAFGR